MIVLQPPLLCEGWGGHPVSVWVQFSTKDTKDIKMKVPSDENQSYQNLVKAWRGQRMFKPPLGILPIVYLLCAFNFSFSVLLKHKLNV